MTESRPTIDHLGHSPDCEYVADHPHPTTGDRAPVGAAVVVTVVFWTATAPLATNMHVPAVAADLSAIAP